MNIIERLRQEKMLPVVKLSDISKAIPMMSALVEGGINCIEITCNIMNALDIIKIIKSEFADKVLVGAGSVMSIELAESAYSGGADFIVTSGLNIDLSEYCNSHEIPILPGVATCTEIELALQCGLKFLKFFPSEACGGTKFLRAMISPYPMAQFMPTGGLTADNYKEYKGLSNVFTVCGSFVVTDKSLNDCNYNEITRLAKQIV